MSSTVKNIESIKKTCHERQNTHKKTIPSDKNTTQLNDQDSSAEQTPISQNPIQNCIIIDDYSYNCVPRPSLPESRIRKVLDSAFIENNLKYKVIIEQMILLKDDFFSIPDTTDDPISPYWNNIWIPPLDGAMIYSTLISKNPRYYIECGSGNSTKFAAHAILKHNLRTKIISIDPNPRAEIDTLCETIYRVPFEKMDLSFFKTLTSEDIFIIDNSHRSLPNSDVTVFFTEVLPELPQGLIYAIHDIALPREIFTERYYNEQYMLAVYLIAGAMGDSIYFPTSYLAHYSTLLQKLREIMTTGEKKINIWGGGFFWMQKK